MPAAMLSSADDVIRCLVEALPDTTFMISHPEAGLVLCSLHSGDARFGDLRIEAYDTYATMDLADGVGDGVLDTVAFYGTSEASENVTFLIKTIDTLNLDNRLAAARSL